MDAVKILLDGLNDSGYQLTKVYEGISDDALDLKVTESAMSPRETWAHLGEAYQAFLTSAQGGEHQWGSYSPKATEWPDLWGEVWNLRETAISTFAAAPDEKTAALANAYITAHDYYHVGQLAQARISVDPSWDPYCIYQH